MSYRDVFDEAIGVTPPSAIEVDEVIARQRRHHVVRMSALVAATVSVLVAVPVTINLFGPGSAPIAVSAQPSATTPAASPTATGTRKSEASAQIARRLSLALAANFRKVAPHATYRPEDTSSNAKPDPTGLFQPNSTGQPTHYLAQLVVTTAAGSGTVTFEGRQPYAGPVPSPSGRLSPRQQPWPPTSCATLWAGDQTAPAGPVAWHCDERSGPEGAQIVAGMRQDGHLVDYVVVVAFANGSAMVADATNTAPQGSHPAEPALSIEQLIGLVADPDMAP